MLRVAEFRACPSHVPRTSLALPIRGSGRGLRASLCVCPQDDRFGPGPVSRDRTWAARSGRASWMHVASVPADAASRSQGRDHQFGGSRNRPADSPVRLISSGTPAGCACPRRTDGSTALGHRGTRGADRAAPRTDLPAHDRRCLRALRRRRQRPQPLHDVICDYYLSRGWLVGVLGSRAWRSADAVAGFFLVLRTDSWRLQVMLAASPEGRRGAPRRKCSCTRRGGGRCPRSPSARPASRVRSGSRTGPGVRRPRSPSPQRAIRRR